jgi:triacylglycerol lipase
MLGPIEYFRDLKQQYQDACFPNIPPVASIPIRAQHLAEEISHRFPAGGIHVIAHSMAGLDARYVISKNLCGLGAAGQIVSLSTISTPHLGSPIADFVLGTHNPLDPFEYSLYMSASAIFQNLGLPVGGLGNLTTTFAQQFNRDHPDSGTVKYFYYAGSGLESVLLAPLRSYIQTTGKSPNERTNDGLVSLASAKWNGDPEPAWTTDHFGEIGYNLNKPPDFKPAFPYVAAYARIVQRLSAL